MIEQKYTKVGDPIKKLQRIDPDLYVSIHDSEYGWELMEVYITVAELDDRHPIGPSQREETGLKPGDKIVQLY